MNPLNAIGPETKVFRTFKELFRDPLDGRRVIQDIQVGGFRVSVSEYTESSNMGKLAKSWYSIELMLGGHVREHYGIADREITHGSIAAYQPFVEHWTSSQSGAFRTCQVRTMEKLECAMIEIPILSALMFQIYREMVNQTTASPVAIESLCAEMLDKTQDHRTKYRTAPRWLKTVKDILHARFSSQVTLSELSTEVGIARGHLARTFRRYERRSIGDYVRLLRLRHALEEVPTTRKSLAQVGAEAGFSDQSHFGRSFRELFGVPPGEYRLRLTEDLPHTKRPIPTDTRSNSVAQ